MCGKSRQVKDQLKLSREIFVRSLQIFAVGVYNNLALYLNIFALILIVTAQISFDWCRFNFQIRVVKLNHLF